MSDINVKVLIDNNAVNDKFIAEHGLSMVIKFNGNLILLDFGLTDNIFTNAKSLGVNLDDVNLAVISHAHYDHTGGLHTFIQGNPKCKIYAREGIDGVYYSTRPAKGIRRLFTKGKKF